MDFSALIDWIKEIWGDLMPFEIIDHYDEGVRLRIGKFHGKLLAGWHWKIPFFDKIITNSVVTTTLSVDPQSVSTLDGKSVVVSSIIKYRISNIKTFLLEVEDATDALADMTMGIIADIIRDMEWSELRDCDLSAMITEQVREESLKWGISVKVVTIPDLDQIRSIRLIGNLPAGEE